MKSSPDNVQIEGMPSNVQSWSAARIPGFVQAVLKRWRHNRGGLPGRFVMVLCPQVEIHAAGGMPVRVRELTDPRMRYLHFTGCHKPYVVLFYIGADGDAWRSDVQHQLAWSEGYEAEIAHNTTHLRFIEATEERDDELVDAM